MVIVTYKSNVCVLKQLIKSISNQVNKIFIIDNTPNNKFKSEELISEKIEVIYLNENKGIAYAQNIGIKKANILLSDQDTIYPEDYILKMIKIFDLDDKIAAIAPIF